MTLADSRSSLPGAKIEKRSPVDRLVKQLSKVDGRLDSLPEPSNPCGGCGGHVVKTLVPYDYDAEYPDGMCLTISKTLPGYRCENCGAEYGATAITDEFVKQVAGGLAELGDTRLKSNMERESADPSTWTTFTPLPESVKKKLNGSGG